MCKQGVNIPNSDASKAKRYQLVAIGGEFQCHRREINSRLTWVEGMGEYGCDRFATLRVSQCESVFFAD